jgi:hypothetical protein
VQREHGPGSHVIICASQGGHARAVAKQFIGRLDPRLEREIAIGCPGIFLDSSLAERFEKSVIAERGRAVFRWAFDETNAPMS